MTRVARISSGASSANRSRARPRNPTARPMAVPPRVISRKRIVASPKDGDPLRMVARTAEKTATPVPSLNRLSPSRIAASPPGAFNRRSSVTTAIGSVAARIAPKRNPLAQLKPSSGWVTAPISSTVMATPTVASSETGSILRRSSARSRVRAAAKTRPGTNASRITLPPRRGNWPPGSSPTAMPAAASTTGYGSRRARFETRPSTVARAPTRMSSSRKRCSAFISQLDAHSVARCFHLGADALRQVGRELPGMCAPDRHAVVREDGKPRLCLTDDPLRIRKAQVRQLGSAIHEDGVDHHDVRLVLLRDSVVVSGVGHPAEPVAETKSIGLDLVHVTRRGGERHAPDAVLGLGFKGGDFFWELTQVSKHDRIAFERIGGAEELPRMREAALVIASIITLTSLLWSRCRWLMTIASSLVRSTLRLAYCTIAPGPGSRLMRVSPSSR